ncbi:phage holin family protein [Ectobacillus ponti]|uniref:Phage holin family protein n=1 Tax=Ectobacillus ponti TaxID=2961894 RepID=A0AA41XC16_9BACI|nr:phage holin family protein [Ectobacillus ponti]MCP8970579.1 phage holin family protein [Ectobacillus ponti]
MLEMLGLQELQSIFTTAAKFIWLLGFAMLLDIVTGVAAAWKEGKLYSRNAWWGYVRKLFVFVLIMLAAIIDLLLKLDGVVTYGTIFFYTINEALSIVENVTRVGLNVPSVITDKLHVIQDTEKKEGNKNADI